MVEEVDCVYWFLLLGPNLQSQEVEWLRPQAHLPQLHHQRLELSLHWAVHLVQLETFCCPDCLPVDRKVKACLNSSMCSLQSGKSILIALETRKVPPTATRYMSLAHVLVRKMPHCHRASPFSFTVSPTKTITGQPYAQSLDWYACPAITSNGVIPAFTANLVRVQLACTKAQANKGCCGFTSNPIFEVNACKYTEACLLILSIAFSTAALAPWSPTFASSITVFKLSRWRDLCSKRCIASVECSWSQRIVTSPCPRNAIKRMISWHIYLVCPLWWTGIQWPAPLWESWSTKQVSLLCCESSATCSQVFPAKQKSHEMIGNSLRWARVGSAWCGSGLPFAITHAGHQAA